MNSEEIVQIVFGILGIAIILLIIAKFFGKREQKNNYSIVNKNNVSDNANNIQNNTQTNCKMKDLETEDRYSYDNVEYSDIDTEWNKKSK